MQQRTHIRLPAQEAYAAMSNAAGRKLFQCRQSFTISGHPQLHILVLPSYKVEGRDQRLMIFVRHKPGHAKNNGFILRRSSKRWTEKIHIDSIGNDRYSPFGHLAGFHEALFQRKGVTQKMVRERLQPPFMLPKRGPPTPAGSQDNRNTCQVAQNPPPDIGYNGQKQQ